MEWYLLFRVLVMIRSGSECYPSEADMKCYRIRKVRAFTSDGRWQPSLT